MLRHHPLGLPVLVLLVNLVHNSVVIAQSIVVLSVHFKMLGTARTVGNVEKMTIVLLIVRKTTGAGTSKRLVPSKRLSHVYKNC